MSTKVETKKEAPAEIKRQKGPSGAAEIWTIVTFVIQIVFTVGLGIFALAPHMSVIFGLILFLFIVVGVIVTTLGSLGIAWTSKGFQNFWAKAWALANNSMTSGKSIVASLKPHIVWISIVMFLVSAVGFVYNLIYFIKYRENKIKFIISCCLLCLAIANMFVAFSTYLWH